MQEKRHPVKAAIVALVAIVVLSWSSASSAQADLPDEKTDAPLLSQPSAVGDLEYRPGRGLRVGQTGLTAGGYGNVTLSRDEGEPARFAVDELSALVAWDPHPRLHGFVELELEDLVQADSDDHPTAEQSQFRVERAYGDLHLFEPLNLRVGKFLTPVGRWNVIHAAPLVWTTSRPVTTERPFDDNTTGAQIFGSFFTDRAAIIYRLFGQFADQLEERPQFVRQDRSAGARLELTPVAGPEVGATYLSYRRRDGDWNQLGGLDAFWQADHLEMLAEAIIDEADDQRGTEWGAFGQLAYEVVPHWFAIGRYERFDPRGPGRPVDLFDFAGAFRPWPNVIVKAEYLLADHRSVVAEPGFKSSFAFMF